MSIEKPIDPLTTLLAELPKVREHDFTERVLYRVHLRELRRRVAFFAAWSCGFAGIVLSLPLERFIAFFKSLHLEANASWIDLANANQLIQALDGQLQMGNFNTVVALGVGAVLIALVTFSLVQD